MSFSLHRLEKTPQGSGPTPREEHPAEDPARAEAAIEAGLLRPLADQLAISRGHGVVLVDLDGRLEGKASGYFHHQARFLSLAELRLDGARLETASAAVTGPASLTARFLAKPGKSHEPLLPPPAIEVEQQYRLARRLELACRLINRAPVRLTAQLDWRLDADFADQDQVVSGRRRPRMQVARHWTAPGTLAFRSLHPKLHHATCVRFRGPAAFRWSEGMVRCELTLDPQQEAQVVLEVEPQFDPAYAAELPPEAEGPADDDWLEGCSRLTAANRTVQDAWDCAAADLRALQLGDGEGEQRYMPAAGMPHYLSLFGRDSLMAGWQSGLLNPSMLAGTLDLVGGWTASAYEPKRDAQPGRVIHQRNLGPIALLGRTPFLRYYGDHTASALYLLGVASAFARSGDVDRFVASRELVLRILDWMDRDGDRDGDGLYEYQTTAGRHGLKNQGWKDSSEGVVYPDGRIVSDPIVVCEVQAIFAAAKRAMSRAFEAAGETALAADLASQADRASRRFQDVMWMPDEGFVAFGLDADKRQIRTLASNGGECLAYGVLDEAQARLVADRLMTPDFFSGWGIRTLAASEAAYNPLGYHLGSVWPCFTALTARGFARYGLVRHLHALARALFDATELFEHRRLPELFGGHARDGGARPGLYPDACWPQAWSSGAVVLLVDTLVGLKPAAPLGAAMIEPKLPDWLPEVTLRNVRLGNGRLDLRVRRGSGDDMACEILADSTGLRLFGPGLDEPSDPERTDLINYIQSVP